MKKIEPLSEGLIIAIISALSYAVAYAYRSGIAAHFDLPPLMLSPSIGDILKAFGAIGAIVLIVWNIAHIVWPLLPPTTTPVGRSIRTILLISFVSAIFLFAALEAKKAWTFLLIIVIFFAFFEFVFPLLSQKKIKGYENKLKEQEKIEVEFHKSTPSEHLSKAFGEIFLFLVALSIGMISLAYLSGLREAKTREEYFVAANHPDYVIANLSDTMALFVKYDPKTRTLKNEYLIVTIGQSLQVHKEHIGRLLPSPISKNVTNTENPKGESEKVQISTMDK